MNGHIHIKINQEEKEQLINLAAGLGLSLSSFIRLVLKQHTLDSEMHITRL